MRFLFLLALAFVCSPVVAQSDLENMIATERSFALLAEAKGTKHAFLQNLAPDGVLFLPDRVNGVSYWNGRGESSGLLSWAPNYADISVNGMLGYTTGNWEYRPKGKDDNPTGFGEFVTLWQRQPKGEYKFVVDIGIEHPKPEKFSYQVVFPTSFDRDANEKNSSAGDAATGFYESNASSGIAAAYKAFASKDIRVFREGQFPIIGKSNLLSYVKRTKGRISFTKRSSFFGAADLSYTVNTYSISLDGKVTEKGNFVQIWKREKGRWQIVLDIFKPVPSS